jgi:Cys-rich protein (TIGR01571 family)
MDPAPEPGEPWKTGLFSVTAEPGGNRLCLMATLCPCIVFGETVGRLDPADVPLGGNKLGATLFYSLCGSLAAVSTRMGIRRKYNLRGSLLEDCLTSVYCGPCALIQVIRHLRKKQALKAVF